VMGSEAQSQALSTPILPAPDSIRVNSFQMNIFLRTNIFRNLSLLRQVQLYYDIATDSSFQSIVFQSGEIRIVRDGIYPQCSILSNEGITFVVPISELQASTTYFYRTRFYGVVDDVVSATRFSTTQTVKTLQSNQSLIPLLLPARTISSFGFKLACEPVASAEAYLVDIALDSTFKTFLTGYNGRRLIQNTITVSEALPETQYYYRFRSVVNGQIGIASKIATVTTLSHKIFNLDYNGINANWNSTNLPQNTLLYQAGNYTMKQADSVLRFIIDARIDVDSAWIEADCGSRFGKPLIIKVKTPKNSERMMTLGFTPRVNKIQQLTLDRILGCKNCQVPLLYTNFPNITSVSEMANEKIHLFPNPATETASISLSLPASSTLRLTLHDALGREVRTVAEGVYAAGAQEFSVSLDGLPSGIYFVRANVGGQVVVRRLAVVR
jgi:hypothetical protein